MSPTNHAVHTPWPGLIEAYRDRLPVDGRLDADHPAGGRHPADPRPAAVREDRLHGASEGRGPQPDRLVQGPRHDDGRHRGGRPRPEGRAVRVDRQHLGLGGRLRRAGRHHLRGADPAGQDRDGQARPGGHARRQDHSDRRQLRRLPGAGPQAHRRLPDDLAGQLASTRCASRGRRPRRSRSSTRWAPRRTSTRCRSATPATSPPTGRATPSTTATGCQRHAAPHARHPGRRRRAAGARASRCSNPETIATAIRIGSPASWDRRVDGAAAVRRPLPGRHRRGDPGRLPPGRAQPRACSSSRPRRPASPGCSSRSRTAGSRRVRPWCAPSPATASRTPTPRCKGMPAGHAAAGRPGRRRRRARPGLTEASVTQTLPAGLTATRRRRGVQRQPRSRLRQPRSGAEPLRRDRRRDNRIRTGRRGRG